MILETNNLSKRYGPVVAADGINLAIDKGMAFGILGPNGSGKTTTLGIVLSVIKPDSGDFLWFGESPASQVYKNIGSLLEVPNFFPYLSLWRNLEVIARIREVESSDIDRVLDETGLLSRKKSRFDTLSLGMKQRMAIASTLLGNPSVLVLDEPANGLDPEGIAEVRKLILWQREQGKTIIMASHILDEVEKVCSHVTILKKGRNIATGKVDELLVVDNVVVASADDPVALKKAIEESGIARSITISGNSVEVVLNENVESSAINRDST
ncbi:MAG: ATP-binding cassette domain-containing protein [Bacteroidales bacterium]